MRITESDLKPPGYGKSGLPREKGTHLSDALDAVERALGRAGVRAGGWDRDSLFEGGFTWEDAFEVAFKGRMTGWQTQVVIERDGVYCSLDVINSDRVIEFKCKWASSAKFRFADQWRWLMQIKGYCYAAKRRKATFYVFFVRGDYASGPCCKRYDLVFTQKELDANWATVLSALGKDNGKPKRRRRRSA